MNKRRFFKICFLIGYLLCVIVLIVEASMNGKSSAAQSDAVGGIIADNLNELKGDTSEIINPTAIEINNPIEEAYVFDTYQLYVTTLPENATYKSIEYKSSDTSIATITNEGEILFHSSGIVTITVNNSKVKELSKSFEIIVHDVLLEDLLINIFDKNNDEVIPTNDVYTLSLENTYEVIPTFLPMNATNKSISYTLDNDIFLKITNNGVITPLKYSDTTITKLTIKSNDIEKQINIKIEAPNLVHLESITSNDEQIYVSQTKPTTLAFSPQNATYKGYKLISNDPNICKIINNTSIKGISEGTTTIKVISTKYPDISSSFTITVLKQPPMEDFNVTANIELIEGNQTKIKLTDVTPIYSDTTVDYIIDDSNIVSVDENGILKALNAGFTTITITNGVISKTVNITVSTKPQTTINNINIKIIKDLILFKNETYNIKDFLNIESVSLSDGTISYENLDFSLRNPSSGIINDLNYTPSNTGYITLDIMHDESKLSKTIQFIVFDETNILINNTPITNEVYNINVYEQIKLNIESSSKQIYDVEIENPSILLLENNTNYYTIKSIADGTSYIKITPIFDSELYPQLSQTILITCSHVYTDFIDIDANKDIVNNQITIYTNEKVQITPITCDCATISQFIYTDYNEEILSVTNTGIIIPHNFGTTSIKVTDTFSNQSKSITINILHYYELDENNPYTFKGDISYDSKKDVYIIVNGTSADIELNFTADSTYKNATYSSSNEKVVTIGKDGVITPHSVGEATITITVDDQNSQKIEKKFTIKVTPKLFIEDLSSFFYIIRKSIGHFGAFLVLGIFSTFTFMMYFEKRRWLAVTLNYVQGFFVAALTEFIQLFVPGRSGTLNDVMIDFTGFTTSFIIITFIFIILKIKQNKKRLSRN